MVRKQTKLKLALSGGLFFMFILFIIASLQSAYSSESAVITPAQPVVRIAVCPTYYDLAEKLDKTKYEIIKTQSTVDSLKLLSDGSVDYIIAGRTLKPDEPQYEKVFLDKNFGMSFLSDEPLVINFNELDEQSIYTDLEMDNIKNYLPNLTNISQVNNVYDYLGKGLIITSWSNTDYGQAEIVHVLDESGNRSKFSRTPIIYCNKFCGQQNINEITFAYEK